MKRKSKPIRGVGTFSAKDIFLRKRKPLIWPDLNKQIIESEEAHEIACFLRINTPLKNMRWRQGSVVLSPDSVRWSPYWQKNKTYLDILGTYNISELTWRRTTLSEHLKLKPQFIVLRANVNDGHIEFAIPETDLPLFLHKIMRHYGRSMKAQEDLEDVIRLVRQQKIMPRIGARIVRTINSFKVKGITVEHKNPGSHDKYLIKNKDFRIEITINPPQWIGMEFHWHTGERGAEIEYRIDMDLYDLSDRSNQWFADEIENDIVEFLEIVRDGRLLFGKKKGRLAIIIPFSEPVLLWRSRFWPYTQRTYKNLDKAKSGGSFSPLKYN